jgi:hypothetical protein
VISRLANFYSVVLMVTPNSILYQYNNASVVDFVGVGCEYDYLSGLGRVHDR